MKLVCSRIAVVIVAIAGCGPSALLPSDEEGGTRGDTQTDATNTASVGSSGDATTGTEPQTSSSSSAGSTFADGEDVSDSTTTIGDGAAETGPACDPTVMCGGHVYACGDGLDNDGDELVDGADPDCLGPCDDGESTFLPALMTDGAACGRDCYFDDNTGSGDDACHWDPGCDPLSPGEDIGCPYSPVGCPSMAFDLRQCVSFCSPLTPNGCDCYGCCTLAIDGELVDVFLGPNDCGSATPENCPPCTQRMEECGNPCETDDCEICIGQTEPTDCKGPGCSNNLPCTANCDCPPDNFCLLGCCYPPPPGG